MNFTYGIYREMLNFSSALSFFFFLLYLTILKFIDCTLLIYYNESFVFIFLILFRPPCFVKANDVCILFSIYSKSIYAEKLQIEFIISIIRGE